MDDPLKEMNGVETHDVKILGSCNGLLCLGAYVINATNAIRTLILWNPSSKEYKVIIPPLGHLCCAYGFGYDSKIKDYKLVCLDSTDVYACSLQSNSWRKVTTIPYNKHFRESGGLLLNGAIHWSAAKTIVAFDVSSETFMNFPFAEEIKPSRETTLTVLGDSLCLVYGVPDVRVDVRVMQNYGVTNSWTKRFTTPKQVLLDIPV
ncbi:F-box/kelch-repeat protein At3g06240-like [Papaver somniferum]|uniref:F-box/kelch-repeat protein At3g06240-like n=1 Tax=Papaver somniferum TaxID=3469 RepID=UPI000E7020BA|nr:F-box/kelch-repeat protein At3g06240-like [Papaver somniferum]